MSKNKILFFGMDGATWRIMQPLFEQGKLPTLQRLCETGASGILKSIEPLVSPAIWTSIASGKSPDKHGIWDFVAGSNSVRCKRIWDMVSESGLNVGLCGYMVTWPPPAVDGFVIPGSFSRGPETHPASLQVVRELDMSQRSHHRRSLPALLRMAWQCHRLGVRLPSFAAAAFAKLNGKLDRDFFSNFFLMRKAGLDFYTDVFIEQTRRHRPNLAMYLFTFVDSTSHNYWKFMEPQRFQEVDDKAISKHGNKIASAYEAADRTIARALRALGEEDTTVIIVSDHGFQSVPEAQGREPDRTVRIKPEALIELLGWDGKNVRTFNIRGATLFRDCREEPVRIRRMHNELGAIRVIDTELPLFNVTVDPFDNLEIRLRDDFVELETLQIRLPNGNIVSATDIVEGDLGAISGDHHPDGIIIAAGPGIKRGAKITGASVLDVAPTMLALLGLPVGRDMDGRVLSAMLDERVFPERAIHYVDTWEAQGWTYEEDDAYADDALKQQLRSLGYL